MKRIVPRWIDRLHSGHVKKIEKPVRGNRPRADGHALTMVTVTTTSFRCECGLLLARKFPQQKKRGAR